MDYPKFKILCLEMITELDSVYDSNLHEGIKAEKFHTILDKYMG